MKKIIIMWLIGVAAIVLLIGSFPLRCTYGVMVSDIARIAGFILMVPFIVIKTRLKKK